MRRRGKMAATSSCDLIAAVWKTRKRRPLGWSHPPGLNRRPADYESAALPAELGWLLTRSYQLAANSGNSRPTFHPAHPHTICVPDRPERIPAWLSGCTDTVG